uniref:XPG-I domain-containing protein n=1 Tax=Mycena chlorophos TaxID=658473 RepID=A0ABQ0LZI1_MYCCL|nr:predicted protein [Mycena chlorophos]
MSPTRLPRIWEHEFKPIARRVSIPRRASEHLVNDDTPYRLGVNFQDWHKHTLRAQQDGPNAQLRVLFCRLMRYACWRVELVVVSNNALRLNKQQKALLEELKSFIEAFGFEWIVAPRLANEELAHLYNSGQIHDILCDQVDPLTYGAGRILRNPNVSLSNQNADGDYDSSEVDHADLYAMADIISNPDVPFKHREDLICANLCISGHAGYSEDAQELARILSGTGLSRRICQAVVGTADAQALAQIMKQWVADVVEALLTAGVEHGDPEYGAHLQGIATSIENAGRIDGFDRDRLLWHLCPVTSADGGELLKSHATRFDLVQIGVLCREDKFWFHDHTMNVFTRRLYPAVIAHILDTAIREHKLTAQRDRSSRFFAAQRVVQYISTLDGGAFAHVHLPGPFFQRVTYSHNPEYPELALQYDLQLLDSIVEHELSGVQRVRRRRNEAGLAYVFASLTRQALPNLCREADARPAERSTALSASHKAPGSKVVVTPPPAPRKKKHEQDMEKGARGSKTLGRLWAETANAGGSSQASQSETHRVEQAASPSRRTRRKAPSKSKAINNKPKVAKGPMDGFFA